MYRSKKYDNCHINTLLFALFIILEFIPKNNLSFLLITQNKILVLTLNFNANQILKYLYCSTNATL